MQRLAAEHHRLKQTVRLQRAPGLDDLPHGVVSPVQCHEMYGEIMGRVLHIKPVRILGPLRARQERVRSGPHNKRRSKRPVNHLNAIKDFIAGNVCKERIGGACPVADKCAPVGKEGRILHEPRHISATRGIQTLLHAVYPPECLSCRAGLADDSGLCGPCWRQTPFIFGDVCEACGAPMQGDVEAGDRCDDCMTTQRPWRRGRSALIYKDRARALVLGLKHGDRHDIVRPAAKWMARALGAVPDGALVAPVPLHWTRMMRRRFNQSNLLARALADEIGHAVCSDLMERTRATPVLDGKSRVMRFETMDDAIAVRAKRARLIAGRPVVLVDDVMTSGATLAACAKACLTSRASEVHVIVLARVVKDA